MIGSYERQSRGNSGQSWSHRHGVGGDLWRACGCQIASNRGPTDAGSNGTRLTAKCSAFFSSGSGHVGKSAESVFELARFETVGTVAYNMSCDCREEFGPESVFVCDTQREVRCEAVHGLDGAFETEMSREDPLVSRRFGHRFANEVVRETMSPDFLSNHFGSLATQMGHLKRGLQRSQVEFAMPTFAIQRGHIRSG